MAGEKTGKPVMLRRHQGPQYSLEGFQHKYNLTANEADRLLRKFGPSIVSMDALMAAKGVQPKGQS